MRNSKSPAAFGMVLLVNLVFPPASGRAQAIDCNGNGVPDEMDLLPTLRFQPAMSLEVGLSRWGVTSADLDGDGDLDLVVGNQDEGAVTLLLNKGEGGAQGEKLKAGSGTMSVEICDVNGDGDLDIVATNRLAHTVSIFINTLVMPFSQDLDGDDIPDECRIQQFRRGDSNADGEVDISDTILMLLDLFAGAGLGSCADALDVDDDGRLTIADPIGLLGHLFLRGLPPAEPFWSCEADPTTDDLRCESFAACGGV